MEIIENNLVDLPANCSVPGLALLISAGAEKIPHSGRTLLMHLRNTYSILYSWQLKDSVCLAGLFHSVYGTASFKRTIIPVSERQTVRNEIGEEAERIAYLFSRTRFSNLIECDDSRPTCRVISSRTGESFELSPFERRAIIEIHVANLLEQKVAFGMSRPGECFTTSVAASEHFSRNLSKLFPLLSPPARRAALSIVGVETKDRLDPYLVAGDWLLYDGSSALTTRVTP